MTNEAELTRRCNRLEEHYHEEVTNLYHIAKDGFANIRLGKYTVDEQHMKWLAQIELVQSLHRQLVDILRKIQKPTCNSL